MGVIKDALYRQDIELCERLSDQIDSLEVMAEMFGYKIQVQQNKDGVWKAYFINKQENLQFDIRLSHMSKLDVYANAAYDKYMHLKAQGEARILVELLEAVVIAQKLL